MVFNSNVLSSNTNLLATASQYKGVCKAMYSPKLIVMHSAI